MALPAGAAYLASNRTRLVERRAPTPMSGSPGRRFQGRIFLAILTVVLVPAALAVVAGSLTLQTIGSRSGTLGAWNAVAETGLELLDAVDASGAPDPGLAAAAARHRQALSESVRLSRLYSFLAERFLQVLPLAALVAGLLIAGIAFLAARSLSRSFGRPVEELAGWTELISRGEPLPSEADEPEIHEIRTLRQALRRMADELEEGRRRELENTRMRSWMELARRVAHEIKNPLTPMQMAAATLTRGREGAEAEAARILAEEIGRLDEMARTFSQYGRLPEGPRSRVDIGELVAGLARRHASPAVPIEVRGPEGLCVDGHYDALERALRNVLMNAVEAQTPGGGSVEVTWGGQGEAVRVTIRDHGPGIPPDLMERIWQPDVTTKSRGTGLGLAIVRQTIRHHGGDAIAKNHPEGGAVFDLRLPAAGAPDADTAQGGLA